MHRPAPPPKAPHMRCSDALLGGGLRPPQFRIRCGLFHVPCRRARSCRSANRGNSPGWWHVGPGRSHHDQATPFSPGASRTGPCATACKCPPPGGGGRGADGEWGSGGRLCGAADRSVGERDRQHCARHSEACGHGPSDRMPLPDANTFVARQHATGRAWHSWLFLLFCRVRSGPFTAP